MRIIHRRRPIRHKLGCLPLFDRAADRDLPPLTSGGRWVHRRTGLPSTIANVVAELAGIGSEPIR
jgi:hypothetical protein